MTKLLKALADSARKISLLALAVLASQALATQTDNHGIHAVPTPGKVVIDGALNDWDLSGQILMCYDLESLKDVYSGKVAMMYDAENLYVSIQWVDSTPMANSHDPRYQASKAWAGDAVQLRIKTDRISHLTLWYYAANNEPSVLIDYGKDLNTPFKGGSTQLFRTEGWKLSDGAEMAFKKNADGKGYVQELKLPWKLITLQKRYQPDERFSCGIELLWGQTDWPDHRYADNLAENASSREFFWTAHNNWGPVILEPKGNLKLPTPPYLAATKAEEPQGPVAISYEIPKEARVTLAINDASGKRIRNLTTAAPRTAGKNTEYWDGLDDNGNAVPPGDYKYIALYHDGIHVNYVMSYANPGNPTWATSDNRGAFYSDHMAATAAAAAGNYVALAAPMGEAGKHLIGCDLEGHRLWGLADREFGQNRNISLATDGNILWIANEASRQMIYRVEIATGRYAPWERTERDREGKEFRVLELTVSDQAGLTEDKKALGNLRSIAYHDNTLAVCLSKENKIKLLNATTGDVKAELKVTAPISIAYDAKGTLLALAENKIVRVSASGEPTVIATVLASNPYGLAVDSDGNMYVSVREPDQNIKVFSPDGKLVREIGQRGGRPTNGPFIDKAMCNPGQIAIDSKMRIWVPEETKNPKRTSIWSTDGSFLFDLVGSTTYCAGGMINPADPTMGFSDNTVYKIDLAKGTWRPVYSVGSTGDPNELVSGAVQRIAEKIINRDGKVYVYTTARHGSTVCTMLSDGKWKVAASVGIVLKKNDREWGPNFEHPYLADHVGQGYAWCDRNGDGLLQQEELTFTGKAGEKVKEQPFRTYYWGTLPDDAGDLYYTSMDDRSLITLPLAGYASSGAPIYNLQNRKSAPMPPADKAGNGEGMIRGGKPGTVILNRSPLTFMENSGKVLGTYPSRHVSVHGSHTATAARSGYLIGPSSVLGTADFGGKIGEIVDLNGNLGENYLFTSDGLWIQSLFKDTRGWFDTPDRAVRGMPMDAITAGGESFGGSFQRTPDGKAYIIIGATDSRVLEVTGLDSIRRFSGTLTYTNEQFTQAQQLQRQRAEQTAAAKSITIPRGNTFPDVNNMKLTAAEIQESANVRYGRIAANYDESNLYVAWRVWSPNSRMRNGGQDDRLLFKTGDCVDLMIGPAKTAKDMAGDVRLLVSTLADKPVAVLYQKVVTGTDSAKRVPFASPVRAIHFDSVSQRPEVDVTMTPITGGYVVRARIPWKTLGITPASGLKLKGDFGVLAADNTGTLTVARRYWSNKATGLVNDVPGEADLEPHRWGDLTLE